MSKKAKPEQTSNASKKPRKKTTKKVTEAPTAKTPTKKKTTKKTTETKEEKPKTTKRKTTKKTTETKEEKPKTTKRKTTKKTTETKEEKPKTTKRKTTKTKEKAPKVKRKPIEKKSEPLTRMIIVKSRLFRLARKIKRRQPSFRHEQAHRWIRVKDSWRKIRGIDNATREKRRGRPPMVEAGYRKPREVRGIHPSGYLEVLVHRPADLENLNPERHAIRIGATVGMRKRQEILRKADSMLLRVLNAGVPEGVIEEEDLFTELEGIDMEVGKR